MSQESAQLLSAEMQALANALRNVRSRLIELVRDGQLPVGAFPDVTTIQVVGLDVAAALERLANDREPTPRTPGPYDADERR
jgi:hypothetical protein